ncbi:DUF4856 domain-containing protein [Fluviicola taffensis]|uniref:DUF4856 domain-containing protein n=1 Tax=Fluviicola taffensis (strain DSM 16823 / NCIMB 13979 / RW262) TaxID=755732 RepID=F2IGX4_FLUTR|nr:DUF4856 domain-containing protein [Fluviicola taffensis]AEA44755.1 hypothetical protein Fluta_2775 [Fluviicola taffensis DSM 16823]
MRQLLYFISLSIILVQAASCKKSGCTDPNASNYNSKAKKDNGSCTYEATYSIPTSYTFTNASGQSTVDYSGQTDRINQLIELVTYAELGESQAISAQVLNDMFANTNGNGNGHFSFNSTRNLKDKCFSLDTATITNQFQAIQTASNFYLNIASNGQAGTLSSGTSTYLFAANGFQYSELIEKSIMGAVFQYQALNIYLGSANMNADNTTPVSGQTYTTMEHYWDEAFGYFSAPINFPTSSAVAFWGKYCNSQNAAINSNQVMMSNFLKGRAAISNKVIADRDVAIIEIKNMWEKIAAYQAMHYLTQAAGYYGTDQAKYLHVLSEAYGFIYTLRFAPVETRKLSTTEVDNLLAQFNGNLWSLNVTDINNIKATLDSNY